MFMTKKLLATYLKFLIANIIIVLRVFTYQSIFPSKGNHTYFLQKEYRVPVEILGGVRIVYFFYHLGFIFF